jgi:hypothetical protein
LLLSNPRLAAARWQFLPVAVKNFDVANHLTNNWYIIESCQFGSRRSNFLSSDGRSFKFLQDFTKFEWLDSMLFYLMAAGSRLAIFASNMLVFAYLNSNSFSEIFLWE